MTLKQLRRYTLLPLAALIIAFTGTVPVNAFDGGLDEGFNEEFFSGNDILYYNPEAGCQPAPAPATTPGSFTVAQGNIRQFTEDIPRLVKSNPDFVTLSETYKHETEDLTPEGYKAFREESGNNQSKSTAVLWRDDKWTLVASGRVLMVSEGPQKWDTGRSSNWVTLREASGAIVSVMSVHHMVNPNRVGPEKRKDIYGKGMDKLVEKVNELSKQGPVVVGGDFNHRLSEAIDDWGATKKLAKANMQHTFSELGSIKGVAVDYIFHTKDMKATKQSSIPASKLKTDHPFLFATLESSGTTGDGETKSIKSPGKYKNPIYSGTAPDPSVIRGQNGKYYMYTTGFQQFVSDDLVKWKKLNDGIGWIKNAPVWNVDRWAPDIAKVGDKYVLSISGGNGGVRRLGYATSDSAAGPFTYRGELIHPNDRGNYGTGYDIDPNIVVTDKGTYLYYGSGRGYIKAAKLVQNGDTLRAERSETVFTTKHGKAPVLAEGAYVHKKEGYYYLYFSSGSWTKNGGTPYQLHVARSTSPTGPFKEQPKPILTGNGQFTHTGHNSIVTDGAGTDYVVYHAYPKGSSDRAVMMDPIVYKAGWPTINDGHPSSQNDAPVIGEPVVETKGTCVCEDPNLTADGGSVDLNGNDNAEKIYNFLISTKIKTNGNKPMNAIQAAAMVGNFYKESGFDPKIVNGIGATGIAQWLGGRKTSLMAMPEPLTLGTQLKFVITELEGPERAIMAHRDFKNASDIEKATVAVRKTYERPGEAEADDATRIKAARQAYKDFGGNTPEGGNASSVCAKSDSDSEIGRGVGNFVDGGEVAGWEIVRQNAVLVDKIYGASMEWKGWCAAIVARTWQGQNLGFGYASYYTMTIVNSHKYLIQSGKNKDMPKRGSILLMSSSSYPQYGHVVIYLGDNKVLNDGHIRNARDILKGRTYYGWVDPNAMTWSKPQALSEADARALRGWVQ